MFRTRSENLHAIYILLFLNIAFFFLEYQDGAKYAALFSFDREAVLGGEIWRLVTWQFTQSGQGWFLFPKPVVLFFTLLLLYLMGSAVEEEWGTTPFLLFFTISTVTSAAIGAALGISLLGSYFVSFSLLFVYASIFPEQTFYLFGVLPIRVRWLAYVAAALLVLGVFFGDPADIAAFGGALAGYVFYLVHRAPVQIAAPEPEVERSAADTGAIRNAARFVAVKKAVANRSIADIDRLIDQHEHEIVRGVNICPPPDYKPENNDGYCIRCEGFAECTTRFLKASRPTVREAPENAAAAESTG
jgi:hypothetical protein